MSRELERRRLLALTTVLVPVPYLFAVAANRVVVAFALGLGVLVFAAIVRGRPPALPNWALNVVGLMLVGAMVGLRPLLFPSLTAGSIHLMLFLAVVRLCSIRTPKEESHLLALLALLALGASATAVDPVIVVYLVAILLLFLFVAARMTRDAERIEREIGPAAEIPGGRVLAATVPFLVLLAIPIFALLPRTRQPLVQGIRSQVALTSGFGDSIDLGSIEDLRQGGDRAVLRVRYEGNVARQGERGSRFRGAVFTRWDGRRWARERRPPSETGLLPPLPRGSARSRLEIDVVLTRSDVLLVPYDTVAIDAGSVSASWQVERTGIVRFRRPASRPFSYSLVRADRALPARDVEAPTPAETAWDESTQGRIRQLAAEVAGDRSSAEDVGRAVESHLANGYGYSLVPAPPTDLDPLERFLFETRTGHCEMFAGAMVLMLRSLGIPARVVAGFAGAEGSIFGNEVVIRQRHAHAWVEAWDADRGTWRVFDPTPAGGRPSFETPSFLRRVRQVWERMEFQWDRWILGFGFTDQFELLRGLRGVARSAAAAVEGVADAAKSLLDALRSGRLPSVRQAGTAVVAVVALVLTVDLLRRIGRGKRRPAGERALREVIRLLEGAGSPREQLVSSTVRELVDRAPAVTRAPLGVLGNLYEREAFGGVPLAPSERAELRRALREVRDRLRASAG